MPQILFNLRFLRTALQVSLAFLLLGFAKTAAQQPSDSRPILSYDRRAEQTKSSALPQALRQDYAVRAAGFEATSREASSRAKEADRSAVTPQQTTDPRQLAPQSRFAINPGTENSATRGREPGKFAIPQIESMTTAATGLAIVVGLFLICMWLLRRSGPKPTTPLPKEAVAVLGRVPLAARNFAHLLQVGNKLVLVSVTPEGVTPITEVTEPQEVDRLLGVCLRKHKHSSTAEFHHVLQQLADEPAKGFLGNEAPAMSPGLRR